MESADGGLSGSEDSLGDSEDESHIEYLIDSLDEEGSMDWASAWVLSGTEEAASLRSCCEADADEDQSDVGHDPSDAESDQSAAPDTTSVIDASSVQSFHPVSVPAVDISDTVPMVATGQLSPTQFHRLGNGAE